MTQEHLWTLSERMKLRMPRPLRLDEPGWEWVDLDFPPNFWRELEDAAREAGMPVNVYLRFLIRIAIETEG